MKISHLFTLVIGLVLATGCNIDINLGGGLGVKGSGVSKTEVRDLDEEFSSIAFEGVGTLEVRQGDESQVTVTADDNLVELLSTEVVDGKLVIKPTESISNANGLKFEIVTNKLESLTIDGAGSAELFDIEGTDLKLEVNGASSLSGSGSFDSVNIEIKGAGSAKLADLKSKNTTVELSGAASATVFASESVDAEINGVGSVTVHGNPANKKKSVNGLGSITYADE